MSAGPCVCIRFVLQHASRPCGSGFSIRSISWSEKYSRELTPTYLVPSSPVRSGPCLVPNLFFTWIALPGVRYTCTDRSTNHSVSCCLSLCLPASVACTVVALVAIIVQYAASVRFFVLSCLPTYRGILPNDLTLCQCGCSDSQCVAS